MSTLSTSQLWAAPEMRWRGTGEVEAIFPFADTARESMGRKMRGWMEGIGKKRMRVKTAIVFGHARAILAPPKVGSPKPIQL